MGQIIKTKEQNLLEIKGLKKHFELNEGWGSNRKLKAVDGIDLFIREGETLGVVGESGCGKSTLGRLIVRLLTPTEGEILFEGDNIANFTPRQMRRRRKDFQMIFQDPFSSLNPKMKVYELIAEPLKTHKVVQGNELKNEVYRLMEIVGLSKKYVNRYPHEFSGGQRQRIGIARALALRPKLIICDEPVSALDVSIQSQILNLLIELQEEFNLTYLFIAHGLPAIKYISDRIAVMYLGRIVEIASKEQLFLQPMHPYTAGLLSAIPNPDPRLRARERKISIKGEAPSAINPPTGCHFHPRCPFAQEICKIETPQLTEKEENHRVACHFPLVKK